MHGFIKYSDLIGRYGVGKSAVDNGLNRHRKGLSKSWNGLKDPCDGRCIWIEIASIPAATKRKYNITDAVEPKTDPFYTELINAVETGCNRYLNTYKKELDNNYSKALDHAKCHAVWTTIYDLSGGGLRALRGTLKRLHHAYRDLPIKHRRTTYKTFSDCRSGLAKHIDGGGDVVSFIIHDMHGKKNAQKYSEWHRAQVFHKYGKHNKFSVTQIAMLVNREAQRLGKEPITEDFVKNVLRKDNHTKTAMLHSRNGAKWFNDNVLRYAVRQRPKYAGSLCIMDGTPAQFYCQDESGKYLRVYFFFLFDSATEKVVGFSLGKSEDRHIIMSAMDDAVRKEGHFPAELVMDNFSPGKTKELETVFDAMHDLNVKTRKTAVGNAQDKGQGERFISTLQSRVFSLFPDYIGEGITSKREHGRRDMEAIREVWKKQGKPTFEQMRDRITTAINYHNATDWSGDGSPNEKYARCTKPHVVPVDECDRVFIFWATTEITVRRGGIVWTHKGIERKYFFKNSENQLAYYRKKVTVKYDASDPSEIYIFKHGTNDLIECVYQETPIVKGQIESTEKDTERIIKASAKKKKTVNHTERVKEEIAVVSEIDENGEVNPISVVKDAVNGREDAAQIERLTGEREVPAVVYRVTEPKRNLEISKLKEPATLDKVFKVVTGSE